MYIVYIDSTWAALSVSVAHAIHSIQQQLLACKGSSPLYVDLEVVTVCSDCFFSTTGL